jgi:acetyl esterase/lipase
VSRVASMVEDWRDTCSGRGGYARGAIFRVVWWFRPQNHLALWMVGLAKFGPQNSTAAVLVGISGGTWYHSEGCVNAKQLPMSRVAVRSKT